MHILQRPTQLIPVIAAMVLLLLPALAAAQSSTFDTTAQGWVVVNYPYSHVASPATHAVAWDGSFGNPPGALHVGDEYSETGVAAPAAYLGDRSALYGDALRYDIYIRYTDNATYPAVILNAGTFSLYYNTPSPPLNAWQSRTIPLTEAGWKYNSWTGPAVTEAQMRDALSHLAGLYIYTEWRTGPDDTHVDNISFGTPCGPVFSQSPAPAAICNGTAAFAVAAGGTGTLSYQWQIETSPGVWVGLGASPTALPCGGTASASPAAATTSVTVVPCAGVSVYHVRCVVTDSCGSAASSAASLTIHPGGSGDGNASGTTDGEDIQGFVNFVLQGGTPGASYCAYDMNGDGAVTAADGPQFVNKLLL